MSKRILITGAAGFIGSHLVRYFLAAGHEIFVLLRRSSNRWRLEELVSSGKITVIDGDLTDIDSLSGIRDCQPDIIIHSATHGAYGYQTNDRAIMTTNAIGTLNLIEAVKDLPFECLINTGSSSEYGPKMTPMSESDCCDPIGTYGVSKLAATHYCRSTAIIQKRPIFTLRLFSPYGHFEDHQRLMPTVINSFLKGTALELNALSPVRDFIFIDDVCQAYQNVIERAKTLSHGDIFNVGYGKQHSVGDVVALVKEITKRDVPVSLSAGQPRLGDQVQRWEADMTYSRSQLGFRPTTSLKEGLGKLIEWHQKR
jgi:nucleoside-diphosphate-sugar epimerase